MEEEKFMVKSYIWGNGDDWEGICTTFDIATQGSSLREVEKLLREAAEDYLEELNNFHPQQRNRLLNRKSPLRLRVLLRIRYLLSRIIKTKANRPKVWFSTHVCNPA